MRLVLEALQPVESMIVNSAADTKRMIEAVDHPALKACLDLGAMAVAGDTIDDYFDLLGDDVATCILSMLRQMARRILLGVTVTAICAPTWIGWWRAAIAELFRPRPMTGAILPTPQLPTLRLWRSTDARLAPKWDRAPSWRLTFFEKRDVLSA